MKKIGVVSAAMALAGSAMLGGCGERSEVTREMAASKEFQKAICDSTDQRYVAVVDYAGREAKAFVDCPNNKPLIENSVLEQEYGLSPNIQEMTEKDALRIYYDAPKP